MKSFPKIGLALGVGGAKGLAHIGAIKVLEREGIPISMIAGASVGALIGGAYAARKDISYVEQVATDTNWQHIVPMLFEPSLIKGLLRGDKLKKFITDKVGDGEISTLPISFAAVATDILTGESLMIREGKLDDAIRASISVPLIFKPIEIDGKVLMDGGLSMPVPVAAVHQMGADLVIALNLNEDYTHIGKTNLGSASSAAVTCLVHHLARHGVEKADVVVTPKVAHFGFLNRFLTKEGTSTSIAEGERAMEEKLPQLREAISNWQKLQRANLPWWKRLLQR